MRPFGLIAIFFFASALVLSGCSSQQSDWQSAQQANTAQAYQQYLQLYPQGAHVADARKRIAAIQKGRVIHWARKEWREAQHADSITGYQQFLMAHPKSQFVANAKQRIKQIRIAQAWSQARRSNDVHELRNFISEYPKAPQTVLARQRLKRLMKQPAQTPTVVETEHRESPKPTPEKTATQKAEKKPTHHKTDIVKGTTYQVQLAALSKKKDAYKVARQMRSKLSAILNGTAINIYPPPGDGALYRVKTTPMTDKAAHVLCAEIKKHGVDCFVANHSGS